MSPALRLDELTREELSRAAPDATLVLPVASTEQHGPHLPLRTDLALVEAVSYGAAERASGVVPVVVAPTLPYGNSQHHLVYGAASIRSSTLLAVLNDLGDSLVASGFRRLFLVNGHGGNDECVRLLTKDLIERHEGVAVAACSYWSAAEAEVRKVAGERLRLYPGHSGWFETSMMLSVAPHLVRLESVPSFGPEPASLGNRGLAPGVAMQKAGEWTRIGGWSDDPTGASAEAGEMMLAAIVQRLADAIVAFHRAAID